jgi:WD40 repeat protein
VPALVDRRLLLVDGDTVQLVHDALLVSWPALVAWLAEDRDELRLQLELTERARDWETAGEDVDALPRGSRLARFEELAAGRPAALNETEHRFLAEGRAAEDAALENERRIARRTRRLLVGASVAFVIALVGGLVAVRQWNRAEQARSAEAAGERAARAQAALQGDSRARAALLSLAALEAAPNFEASAGLGAALSSFERPVDTLQIHADDVIFGAMSADGRYLTTGSWDHTARVWDALTMEPVANLRGATTATTTVLLSPDNTALAMVACHSNALDECDPVMRIWAIPDGSPLVAVPTGRLNRSLTWLGADRVAVAHPDGVTVWSRDGRPLADVPAAALAVAGGLTTITAVGSAGEMAVGSDTGELRWFTVGEDGSVGVLRQATVSAEVTALAAAPDGSLLAAGDDDGTLTVVDTATGGSKFTGPAALAITEENPVLAVAFSPNGGRVLAGGGRSPVRQGGDNDLRMWSAVDGRLIRRFTGISEPLQGVGFRADGRITAVSVERRARVFEQNPSGLVLEQAVQQICDDEGGDVWWLGSTQRCWATGTAFLPDSRLTLVTGWDRTVALTDATTGEVLDSRREPDATTETPYWNWPKRIDVSADGTLVAGPTDDGGVQLWRLEGTTLTPTVRLPGRVDDENDPVMVNNVAFDPTATRLAVAEEDGGVAVWDLDRGAELWRGGHGPPSWNIATFANDVDWDPDGVRLVSAGGDARLRLWDGATGRQLAVTEENSYVQNVSQWSPDGRTIFSAGSDGVMRVWTADLTLRREFHLGVTAVVDADFTTDGSLVAVADQAYVIRVVDPSSGRQLASFPLSHEPTSVDFSPDGRSIVATDKQGTLTTFAGPALWVDTACRLAGRNLSQNEWDGFAGSDRAYRRLCGQLPVGDGAPVDAPVATDLAEVLVEAVS